MVYCSTKDSYLTIRYYHMHDNIIILCLVLDYQYIPDHMNIFVEFGLHSISFVICYLCVGTIFLEPKYPVTCSGTSARTHFARAAGEDYRCKEYLLGLKTDNVQRGDGPQWKPTYILKISKWYKLYNIPLCSLAVWRS